jgi:hypothetical protein
MGNNENNTMYICILESAIIVMIICGIALSIHFALVWGILYFSGWLLYTRSAGHIWELISNVKR